MFFPAGKLRGPLFQMNLNSQSRSAKPEVSIFDLLNAVNSVLKRFEKREGQAREIFEDKWSVSEKIEFIIHTITGGSATGHGGGSIKFSQLFESAASRAEVVCTFLALLELIRLKQLVCVQPEAFGEIAICRAQAEMNLTAESAESAENTGAINEPKPEPSPHPDPLPSHPMGAEREQQLDDTEHSESGRQSPVSVDEAAGGSTTGDPPPSDSDTASEDPPSSDYGAASDDPPSLGFGAASEDEGSEKN